MRKIPTLFVRDFEDDPRYLTREVHPDCGWVFADTNVQATRKYDGTCFMRADDGWWMRREVKPGKKPPEVFREIEHDPETGKTVGWGDANESGFMKYLAEALESPDGVADFWGATSPVSGATYELVGPRVNGNPEGAEHHTLIRHGYMSAIDQEAFGALPLDFDGLAAWLHAHRYEGIVWHHEDGRMAKLKRKDFPA